MSQSSFAELHQEVQDLTQQLAASGEGAKPSGDSDILTAVAHVLTGGVAGAVLQAASLYTDLKQQDQPQQGTSNFFPSQGKEKGRKAEPVQSRHFKNEDGQKWARNAAPLVRAAQRGGVSIMMDPKRRPVGMHEALMSKSKISGMSLTTAAPKGAKMSPEMAMRLMSEELRIKLGMALHAINNPSLATLEKSDPNDQRVLNASRFGARREVEVKRTQQAAVKPVTMTMSSRMSGPK